MDALRNFHKPVIMYGAGISGRGAAEVMAHLDMQVYLYNDEPCTIDDKLAQTLQAVGGGLVIGCER